MPDQSEAAVGPRRRARRILYVIGSLDVGGSEWHLARITPRLTRLGWQPEIYCTGRRGALAGAVQAEGVTVTGPPAESLFSSGSRLLRALALAASAFKLFCICLTRRPRIAHFFLPQAYLLGGAISLLARIPGRVMSRRSLNVYRRNHPLAWKLELRLHRHMTAILGNSRSVVRQLVEEEGCDPARTRLIYNGIDLPQPVSARGRTALRKQLGLDNSALVMLIVANLIPYKGHADLLEALAGVRERLPSGWVLLCAGRDDGCGASLREQAAALGIASNIRFLGQRDDVPELFAASDIGLLCSHEEGFSNAIIEGMASRLPMIVTDVGGNAEAVVNGDTGIVVPPSDPRALGAAILGLANISGAQRRAMGERARRRVGQHFSLDACVAAYDALYRELLASETACR